MFVGHIITAAVAPTVNDDSSKGMQQGYCWYDNVALVFSICADPGTTGNAVWVAMNTTISAAAASGAITQKSGIVYITKGTAAALTIGNPTATTDDGKTLTIISTTAAAHTVDNSAGAGFNGGGAGTDIGTFGGAKGDNMVITAYQGVWYVVSKVNVTLA